MILCLLQLAWHMKHRGGDEEGLVFVYPIHNVGTER